MAAERVEWGSLVGIALLFTLVILVMRVLWRWLVVLLVLGPPAFAGVVAGHIVGLLTRNTGVGLLVAVVASGLLGDLARGAIRVGTSPTLPERSSNPSGALLGRRPDMAP